MADSKISALKPVTALSANDLLLVVSSPGGATDNYNISYQNFFAGVNKISANTIPFFTANTPANSTSTQVPASVIFYDTNYLYVSVANNVVKRVALNSF